MKAIKKVSVTPLADNTGVIIDSLNTTDDKHTNAPSIQAVNSGLANKSNTSHNHDSTYSKLGHTHTKSQITDFPTSLKNPNALTLQLNGTSQGGYDGSAAKTINVTASSVGAIPASNFLVLQGNIEGNPQTIPYPNGYNQSNTIIVSVLSRTSESSAWKQTIKKTDDTYSSIIPEVMLGTNNIALQSSYSEKLYYKIVLMKI